MVRGVNDVSRQIASSVELGARSYTISYSPTSASEAAAKYRGCPRSVPARGADGIHSQRLLLRRDAPRAVGGDGELRSERGDEGTMPLNGIRVTVGRDTSSGAPPDSYIVHAEASDLSWKQKQDGSATASVYVMAVSLNAKGKMLGHTLLGMTATAKPETDLQSRARTDRLSLHGFAGAQGRHAALHRARFRDRPHGLV